MAATGGPRDKIVSLDRIESSIFAAINSAGHAIQELSKDKPVSKQTEQHTTAFLKTLQDIETGLSQQINYLTQVSTGQPHEGSCYAAQKDLQMAFHRIEHVKSRLTELDKLKNEHLHLRQAQAQGMIRSYSLPEQPH
ncbi:hypothetical protein LOTGIDRAFT_162368 [Lottia gigantea]|uniref:Mediator of RNA polymerase II transcription subunit 11 n=1 Tax=Lottia gigantea TaxID=225164 RepID=V4AHM9_LOTGI|nr:hypothetical protein LOTGIDRAFT_162368 [Lottia gigantea]ESO92891.1 hypothetical protein LOTGIDRAFT_162368 [Lottia gigantea]